MSSRPRRTANPAAAPSVPAPTRRPSAAVRKAEGEKKKAEEKRVRDENDNIALAAQMELIQRTKEIEARASAARPLDGLSNAEMDRLLLPGARRSAAPAASKPIVPKPSTARKIKVGGCGKAARDMAASHVVPVIETKSRGRGRTRGRGGGRGGRQASTPQVLDPLVSDFN